MTVRVDPAAIWALSMARVRHQIADLVQEIIPQAKSTAWRYFQRAPHVLEREELEAVAFEGLTQAAAMWAGYCARNGYDPAAVNYFGAYATRRMRGAILDYLRASDWVTRNTRQRFKAITAAGEGRSDTELAADTGLTPGQVRAARASVAAKPASLDEGERDVPEVADTESHAQASAVLAALAAAQDDLPPLAATVVALCYYQGLSVAQAAALLGVSPAEAAAAHDTGVRTAHQAMLRAVA